MTSSIPTRRLRRITGDDRIAIVSAEPSMHGGRWLVRAARGPSAKALATGTVYGPFSLEVAQAKVDEIAAQWVAEGFAIAIHEDLITALSSNDAAVRARAARAVAWRRSSVVVPALLEAANHNGTDITVIVEALGRIGDLAGLPIARQLAGKKLLSRRRAGVEAVLAIGESESIAEVRAAGRDRLPSSITSALANLDELDPSATNIAPLIAALDALELKAHGLALDQLYELGAPALVAAVHHALGTIDIAAPHRWRYVKSIFKRAMTRDDGRTFAIIVRAVEVRACSTRGKRATVKSGLDGVQRSTRIFGVKTQRWAKRASDRYLRHIAAWMPERYAPIAAEVLAAYRKTDRLPPPGDRTSHLHAFNRIVFGRSLRKARDGRSLEWSWIDESAQHTKPVQREDAFPQCWDAQHVSYLRVLRSGLPEALDFALEGIARHPELASAIETRDLPELLATGHDGAVALALAELERRFDATRPDLELISLLLEHPSSAARTRGADMVVRSRSAWWNDASSVRQLLERTSVHARSEIATTLATALADAPLEVRQFAAATLVAMLREDRDDAALAPIAELIASALRDEASSLPSTTELITWLDRSPSVQNVAGVFLALRPDALSLLGMGRLVVMSDAEPRSVRAAAVAIMRGARAQLALDLAPLFTLAESRWDDVRAPAIELLRETFDLDSHGAGAIVAICDSNHADVQALGRDLAIANLAAIDSDALLHRLVEHPSRQMRAFAMELVERHLRPGLVPLARCESFFRVVLLEPRADADTKRRVITFLAQRGLHDEQQAAFCAQVLERALRTRTVRSFELIVSAIAMITAQHPEVRTALVLHAERAS